MTHHRKPNISTRICIGLAVLLAGCTNATKNGQDTEDLAAKQAIQGIWADSDTQLPTLRFCGDTLYYLEGGMEPLSFKIVKDTLYTQGLRKNAYFIAQLKEHVLQLVSPFGTLVNLMRPDETEDYLLPPADPEADNMTAVEEQDSTEVIQKDNVTVFEGERYHGYVFINPTRYKVLIPEQTDTGLTLDHAYYDNIIHICVYCSKEKLFAQDIQKSMMAEHVPESFMQYAILSDMDFLGVDAHGYHFMATLQNPQLFTYYNVNIDIPSGSTQMTFSVHGGIETL